MRIWDSVRRDVATTGAGGVALLLLFLSVVLNRYRFDDLPFRPQPEHLMLVVALVILGVLLVRRLVRLSFQWGDMLLGAYFLVALGSSILYADQPRESIQYWIRMLLAAAVYFVVRWLIPREKQGAAFRLSVKALLIFGVVEAAYGIVGWFLYPLGVNLGVDQYPLGVRGPGGIVCNFSLTMYGTLWEPNVFAGILMTIVLIGATLFVSNEFRAWRKPLGIALLVMIVALALNASRGALGTLALGLVLVLLLAHGMTFTTKLKWLGAAVLVILLVNIPSLELAKGLMTLPNAPGLAERAPCARWIAEGMPRGTAEGDPVIDPATGPEGSAIAIQRLFEQQTLDSRFITYELAIVDFTQHPLLGNGANSFGQKYTTTAHTPGWISNAVLMALHDTGILGLLLLVAWFGWYAWRVFRAWRRGAAGPTRTLVLALGIGLIGLLVEYQFTTALWFGFAWWYLAILEFGATRLRGESLDDGRLADVRTTV